ncbi:kinase-like domain-containing protein [Xylaria nigripes]|nr:kinase-like domain-containing protein [Xylaria nigripes]
MIQDDSDPPSTICAPFIENEQANVLEKIHTHIYTYIYISTSVCSRLTTHHIFSSSRKSPTPIVDIPIPEPLIELSLNHIVNIMDAATREKIKSEVFEHLEQTPFAASSLQALSGGTANFIYHASLKTPVPDGTRDVLIKHGEGYVANSPAMKLTLVRCAVEKECLTELSKFHVEGKTELPGNINFTMRTPRFYYFDEQNNIQVQEIMLQAKDLKTYSLSTYPANTPETLRPQCFQLGRALGKWLRNFHTWGKTQAGIRETVARNAQMQQLKHMINFSWLVDRVAQFPTILSEAKDVFEAVKDMTAKELENEGQLQIIHGDLWTGNVLLPDSPIRDGSDLTMFIIDWEMSQLGMPSLDLGQMIAELYELKLFKDITAGLWMVQGFTEGYGPVSDDFAFRTAIQTGAHLISFGTSVQNWGTTEQVEMVARTGRDIIVQAWRRDREWFRGSDLDCLFQST